MWKPSEVISFAKDCIAHGIKAISLGGGEPFEYKGVFEIIDALRPEAYLSVTSNGLPLQNSKIWDLLLHHSPDKIHITIHQPDNEEEVERVITQIKKLKETEIKPGVNLLVAANKINACKKAYSTLSEELASSQIILVPQRFSNTPMPKALSSVTGGEPFQSPSCLLECKRPRNFCSISWDKKVNSCSFAGGKEKMHTLDYKGLTEALEHVSFTSCIRQEN